MSPSRMLFKIWIFQIWAGMVICWG